MTTETSRPTEPRAALAAADGDLEALLGRVECELAALGDALRRRDSNAIEGHAQHLHQALERAVSTFQRAARQGGVPAPLRSRLVKASGQVAAQRESLVRATVALDRAIDTLLPRDAPTLYGSRGWTRNPAGAYQG
ncbi:MAG: hypothetical protein AB9M60_03600 [Leptothrix sp. (in: b-proteobacteria)]